MAYDRSTVFFPIQRIQVATASIPCLFFRGNSHLHNRLYLIGMDKKQINLQTMCEMSDKELSKLLDGLRAIEGFTFFVNCQFKIKNEVNEMEDKISHT